MVTSGAGWDVLTVLTGIDLSRRRRLLCTASPLCKTRPSDSD